MAGPLEFASLIRRRRLELGLTRTALARRSGSSPAAVSRWEKGERVPSPLYLRALTRELGIDLRDALCRLYADPAERAYVRMQIRRAESSDAA